jgi:hypothetical protein
MKGMQGITGRAVVMSCHVTARRGQDEILGGCIWTVDRQRFYLTLTVLHVYLNLSSEGNQREENLDIFFVPTSFRVTGLLLRPNFLYYVRAVHRVINTSALTHVQTLASPLPASMR